MARGETPQWADIMVGVIPPPLLWNNVRTGYPSLLWDEGRRGFKGGVVLVLGVGSPDM